MNKTTEQNMLAYIDALEEVNEQLVFAVKKCVEIFAQLKQDTPDPEGWQGMLDEFDKIIKVGEGLYEKKALH